MMFVFGAIWVWLVLSIVVGDVGGSKRQVLSAMIWSAVATALLTTLLYLPVAMGSGLGTIVNNRYVQPAPWSEFVIDTPIKMLEMWQNWHRDMPAVVAWLLLGGFVVAHLPALKASRYRVPLIWGVILWIAPIVVVRRLIYVSPRIWLYLLPLYLLIASAGLVAATRWAGRFAAPLTDKATLVSAVGSLAICLWVGTNILRSQSVYFSPDTGRFHSCPAVVAALMQELEPGDRVVVSKSAMVPMWYYFSIRGVSLEHLIHHAPGGRLFVVADGDKGEDWRRILDHRFLKAESQPGDPQTTYHVRQVRQCEQATIHEIQLERDAR